MSDFVALEYQALRQEVLERAKLLHQMISFAVILSVVCLIGGVFLRWLVGVDSFVWFLLITPLIFVGLTFNYQANQITLEAVARYINDKLRPQVGHDQAFGWEQYFTSYKKTVRRASFLKVTPLLAPTVFIFAWFSLGNFNLTDQQLILIMIDVVVFLLSLVNFRYKLIPIA